jgi:ribosome maturation factor RimP
MAALTKLIEPEATRLGLRLVRVHMFGGQSDPTLQVMAERPETRQLTLDDCGTLSRALSEILDALDGTPTDPIDHGYRLEVSSPGIDRPLTRLADYSDWQGHSARVRLAEPVEGRKHFDGVISVVDDDMIRFETAKAGALTVSFDAISDAKLLLTDKLIKATAPLSTEGADKILEER